MTKDKGAVSGGIDYAEATSELRRTLAERLPGRPVPSDLVVTTRAEIERREFRSYAQGWRDRGEHEDRRGSRREPAAGPADGAKVLPFPQPQAGLADPARPAPEQSGERRAGPYASGPHPHPSGPPTARPHPSDDLP